MNKIAYYKVCHLLENGECKIYFLQEKNKLLRPSQFILMTYSREIEYGLSSTIFDDIKWNFYKRGLDKIMRRGFRFNKVNQCYEQWLFGDYCLIDRIPKYMVDYCFINAQSKGMTAKDYGVYCETLRITRRREFYRRDIRNKLKSKLTNLRK